jgi:thymidine kinase
MFASKTTRMMADFLKYTYNKKGIVFMNSMDTRFSGGDELITHNKKFKLPAKRTDDPLDIIRFSESYDVIAIDELQFMKMKKDSNKYFDEYGRSIESIADIIEYLVRYKKKIVLGTGLIGDYRRKEWKLVSECIPLADKIIHIKGECQECGSGSTTSYMKGHRKKDLKDAKQVVISSDSIFIPLCTRCYYKNYE